MSDLISAEELESIKKECVLWSNNCGGCETCERFFGSPPLYNHQETYYMICMIEDRNKRIEELENTLKSYQKPDTLTPTKESKWKLSLFISIFKSIPELLCGSKGNGKVER